MKRLLLLVIAAMTVAMACAQNNSPLCFTARNGSVTVRFDIKNITHTIQYSTDCINWNTYSSNTNVTINANQSIYFRANSNKTVATAFGGQYITDCSRFYFTSTNNGTIEGSGNIMSLYGPNCPNLPLQAKAFKWLFASCDILTKAPSLPATTLAEQCYYSMFSSCTALTTAPSLPATTLAQNCYSSMFANCTALTAAPSLPATTLVQECYSSMFSGCTALTTAPSLPATTLAETCYSSMFSGCTALATPPALPATSLASWCYWGMFSGCTSITTLPELPASTLYYGCYAFMFSGCSSLEVNTKQPGKRWIIPVTTTSYGALDDMFFETRGTMDCTPDINTPYYIASDKREPLYFTAKDGSVTVRFDIKNISHTIQYSTDSINWNTYTSNTNVTINANQSICFRAVSNQIVAAAFGDSLVSNSSRFYFTSTDGGTVEGSGNIMALYGPDCPDLPLHPYAFANLFNGCDILTSSPSLPATTLASSCYRSMFIGCTSLLVLPDLPATILPSGCYGTMFGNCISLIVNTDEPGIEWAISATSAAKDALNNMFSGTSGTMNGTPSVNTTYYKVSGSIIKPLCFTARNGSVDVRFSIKNVTHTIQYSTDGYNWNTYTSNTDITINANQNIYFRAAEDHIGEIAFGNPNSIFNCSRFYFSSSNGGTVEGSGNVMSLYGPHCPEIQPNSNAFSGMFYGCSILTRAPELPSMMLGDYCYSNMFSECTSLTTAPELPATTLKRGCYKEMFSGCTALTAAPELFADTLANECYMGMFSGCTSLTVPPRLPVLNLEPMCYKGMFSGCTAITTAPELPSTSLAQECYMNMFSGCTALDLPPILRATTLVKGCYSGMFSGCTAFTQTRGLPARNLSSECYRNMFSDCTSLTTPPDLPATTLEPYCYAGMFSGCTAITTTPELPVLTLRDGCYEHMFAGCISLTTPPDLPATTLEPYCYAGMFSGCTALTTTPELPALTLQNFCYIGMFEGCTSLTTPPVLPATNLAGSCYQNMFAGCTSLTTPPVLPATNIAGGCYQRMFNECTALTTAPALPATTICVSCYEGMFFGCISLTAAPALPATTLAERCYANMFAVCYSLTTPPELPATTLDRMCYYQMFGGCISLTKAPALPATTLYEACYTNMFALCESLTTPPPALPATDLQHLCYTGMFSDCKLLATMPQLPATTLALSCCKRMYMGCSSLKVNTEGPGIEWTLPATSSAADALSNMFGVTGGTMNSTPSLNTTYYIASDPSVAPLQFKAKNDSVTVRFDIKNITHTIQYSTDGISWNTYTPNANLTIYANHSIYFRADSNQTNAVAFGNSQMSDCSRFYFTSTNGGTIEGSGNIMSLYGPDCPDLPLQPYAFNYMFYDCTSLTTIPSLLATSLASNCYNAIFSGCTSLIVNTDGPGIEWKIPTTSTESDALSNMFAGTNGTMNGTPSENTTYYLAPVYRVIVNVNDSTMGSASGSGLYSYGTVVKFTATPYANHSFVSWDSYDDIPTTVVSIKDDITMTAIFADEPTLTVTTVSNDKSMGSIWYEGTGKYGYNSDVTLWAMPNSHCHLVNWSNGDTARQINFTITSDTTFTAYFAIDKHIVTVLSNNDEYGEVTGGGEFEFGATMILTAIPHEGYIFNSWSNGDTSNIITHTVDKDTTITAIFAPISSYVEDVEDPEYIVYSNKNNIYIYGAHGQSIMIYDMQGKMIYEVNKASYEQMIPINVQGVYFVRINNDKSIKVIVE